MTVITASYQLTPNADVKAGRMRLRQCDALTAMTFAEREKIHPGDLRKRLTELPRCTVRSAVTVKDTSQYEWDFYDGSTLVWVESHKRYAIKYPANAKVIFVPPKGVTSFKERVSPMMTNEHELELIAEIEKIYKDQTPDFSEFDEQMIGLGCG